MSSYLQIFILSLATCARPAQLRIYMSVKVGSSALLPCDWRNTSGPQSFSQSPHVEWRTFSETVLERRGEQLYQSERYKGRVDVPEDQLLKGNCSLVLKDVRAEDEAVYESYLLVKRSKRFLWSKRVYLQSVELSVDLSERNQRSDSITTRDAGVVPSLSSITVIVLSLGLLQCC